MTVAINSLWIGGEMGAVHAACLRSFIRVGYKVVLHCYEKPSDAPSGVDFFDASFLMRPDEIVRHKSTGSLALASDIYRYRILREGLGIYVDADVYCLKPLPESQYLLGYENTKRVNGAVLGVPQDSRMLADILRASEDPYFIPPWLNQRKRGLAEFKKSIGFPRHIARQGWGAIGPSLLTYLVEKNELSRNVQPIDILYPLHYGQVCLLFERGLGVADIVTSRSCAVHLYNNSIKDRDVVPDTPLHEIISNTA